MPTIEYMAGVMAMGNMGFDVDHEHWTYLHNCSDVYEVASSMFGGYAESEEDMDAFIEECEGWHKLLLEDEDLLEKTREELA